MRLLPPQPKGTLDDLTPSPRRWRDHAKSIPTGSGAGQRAEPRRYQQAFRRPEHSRRSTSSNGSTPPSEHIANQSAANDQQHASYWAPLPISPTSIVNLKTEQTSSGK